MSFNLSCMEWSCISLSAKLYLKMCLLLHNSQRRGEGKEKKNNTLCVFCKRPKGKCAYLFLKVKALQGGRQTWSLCCSITNLAVCYMMFFICHYLGDDPGVPESLCLPEERGKQRTLNSQSKYFVQQGVSLCMLKTSTDTCIGWDECTVCILFAWDISKLYCLAEKKKKGFLIV